MGYYVQVPEHKGKVKQICELYDGQEFSYGGMRQPTVEDFRHAKENNWALICVIDNGAFEAAGFAYDEMEFKEFAGDMSGRPKEWVVLDWNRAVELTGYMPL